jgi:hypothetical protein
VTVYVDDLKIRTARYPRARWAHMMTDGDIEELHQMASRIGMKREWFQDHPIHPHYDVTQGRRIIAIKNGAVPISAQEIVRRCSRKGAIMEKPIVIHAAGKVYRVTVRLDPRNGYAAVAENLETGEILTDGTGMTYPTETEALAQLRQILELTQ